MNLFPQFFVQSMIVLSLLWTVLGAALLLGLLWKDLRDDNLW